MNEMKFLAADQVEFKTSDEERTIEGYGAVFGNVDHGGDLITRGAFATTIERHMAAKSMPKMLLQHDFRALPIGRWEEMHETERGLWMKGRFIDTQAGRDTYTAVKEGVVDGLSIGFKPVQFTNRVQPSDPKRTLKAVDLMEVSVVTFPMNDQARVLSVKSAEEIITIRDLEEALRAHGFSKSEALSVVSRFESKAELQDRKQAEEVLDLATSLIAAMKTK